MDFIGALGTVFSIVASIHDGMANHNVGRADIKFQLARYQTYNTNLERNLMEKAKNFENPTSCILIGQRLFSLHGAVIQWLEANKFKIKSKRHMQGARLPHCFLAKKAISLKDIVDYLAEERNKLHGELEGKLGLDSSPSSPVRGDGQRGQRALSRSESRRRELGSLSQPFKDQAPRLQELFWQAVSAS
ncbi:hypothetical protein RBB50_012473 [Rhinocladiella similis]